MPTRHVVHTVAAAFLALALGADAVAQQTALKISPRDKLTVSVWNNGVKEDTYSVEVIVDADGTFEYPTLGRVKAAGLTNREVEQAVKKQLEKDLVSPQVTIDVEQSANKKFVISGEVKSPASYTFGGDFTIFDAVVRAGSLTEQAGDEAVIYRRRPDGTADADGVHVDLYELMANPATRNNVAIQDGDYVVIPKSEPVYITGFVQTQGPYQVKRGTTISQALSMAGGVTERGAKSRIKIQRMVNGKKKDIEVKDIDTDVVQPGDTIVVPARIF
jgi:polysaccharide export outer membrane protein